MFNARTVSRQALTRVITAQDRDGHTSEIISQNDDFRASILSCVQPGEAL